MPDTGREAERRQLKQVAIVIVAAAVLWLGVGALGQANGWPVRFVFLMDLAFMAAMVWALIVLYRVWRARQDNGV